jgi:hypothetical protein
LKLSALSVAPIGGAASKDIQKLRDAGITSIGVTSGHQMSETEVTGLIEFFNSIVFA